MYDLLPPSRLATLFYFLGIGIYHTSLRIPALGVEFCYGGLQLPPPSSSNHDHRQTIMMTTTGIFSLPSPDDYTVAEAAMPGLRFLRRLAVGTVVVGRDDEEDAGGRRKKSNGKPKEAAARDTYCYHRLAS